LLSRVVSEHGSRNIGQATAEEFDARYAPLLGVRIDLGRFDLVMSKLIFLTVSGSWKGFKGNGLQSY
jgi:hypothetical protein